MKDIMARTSSEAFGVFVALNLFVATGLIFFSLFDHSASAQSPSCHQLTSAQSIPNGFSAAYNPLTSSRELLISGTCSSTGITAQVGTGNNFHYVYEQSYIWNGSSWQQILLQGSNKNSVWYVGQASATIPRTQAQLQGQTFFVGYICQWIAAGSSGSWKCGCRDAACATPNWQLQVFQATQTTTGQTTGTGSTTDVDTNGLRAHATESSCWVVYAGNVYDMTNWLTQHPGGAEVIAPYCGTTDFQAAYEAMHGASSESEVAQIATKIGRYTGSAVPRQTTGGTTTNTTGTANTTGTTNGSTSGTTTGGNSTTVLHAMQGNVEQLVTGLDTVWDIAFLPDGTLLLSERAGRVVHVARNGTKTVTNIEGVREAAESGMHGMVLHPNFSQNNYVYIYYRKSGATDRIERYTFANGRLQNPQVIFNNIPEDDYHNGGGLEFGPDGKLYVGAGENYDKQEALNTNSLKGKILRINDDGSIPSDNPFGNAVWSYGHRNPQGLVFDNQNRLWSSEHGPSGSDAPQGYDEINLIEKGKHYGWPTVWGSQSRSGMESPKAVSGTGGSTWAPSGIAYWNGTLFWSGLRGQALYQAPINGSSLGTMKTHFKSTYGRIRAVALGPDGMIYFGTSNGDQVGGQGGTPDRVIRVNPNSL